MDPVEQPAGQEPAETPTGQEPAGGSQSSEALSLEDAKKLRRENQSLRGRLRELEEKTTSYEAAQMTELERAKAEVQTAKTQAVAAQEALRQARADALVSKAATQYQVDAELLSKLVTVEFGDNGEPVAIDGAVNDLLKKHPNLAGGVGLNSTNPQRKGALTLEDVKRMTPEQINARWDDVQVALKTGR